MEKINCIALDKLGCTEVFSKEYKVKHVEDALEKFENYCKKHEIKYSINIIPYFIIFY